MAERDTKTGMSGKAEKAMAGVSQESEMLMGVMMNHLLEAEGNFIGLYDQVIGQVKDNDAKAKLKEFRGDHERHVKEIRGAIDQMNADVLVNEPKPTPMGRAMAQRLSRINDDKALISEFLVSEDLSRRTYQWASMMGMPERLARVIQHALDDEDRHYRWAAKYCGIDAEPL